MHRRPIVTILIILLGSMTLHAQGIGIGPILGIHKSADVEGNTLMGGVALRLKLSPALGVEGSIQYRQEKYAGDYLTVRSWPVIMKPKFSTEHSGCCRCGMCRRMILYYTLLLNPGSECS